MALNVLSANETQNYYIVEVRKFFVARLLGKDGKMMKLMSKA